MSDEPFDDAPRWYWAAAGQRGAPPTDLTGDRFVVACGQRELWERVRIEVDQNEQCAWMSFGPTNEAPKLADCFRVFMTAREMYGANLNRIILELAQVPAFAEFIRERPGRLCDMISNPISHKALPREPYSRAAETALGRVVGRTLGLPDEWWEQ